MKMYVVPVERSVYGNMSVGQESRGRSISIPGSVVEKERHCVPCAFVAICNFSCILNSFSLAGR